MSGLKAEIQLEMNARKEESGEDLKGLDMKVMVSPSRLLWLVHNGG